jgi:hypothetical protein
LEVPRTVTHALKVSLGTRSVLDRERKSLGLNGSVELVDTDLVALDRARLDVGLLDHTLDHTTRLGLGVLVAVDGDKDSP